LKSGFAFATTAGQRPLPVPFAQIGRGGADHFRVDHATTCGLFYYCDLFAGRRCWKFGEIDGDLRTGYVVDFDGKEGYAGALVAERKVYPLLRHGNAFHFGVDVHFAVGVEAALARRYATL
jgi:hypothetical protein